MSYITYLLDPEQHTNAAVSYPGIGETKEESQTNSHYWPNQLPWVRTVAASRAPKWAQQAARSSREIELECMCKFGYDRKGNDRTPTAEELKEYDDLMAQRIYGWPPHFHHRSLPMATATIRQITDDLFSRRVMAMPSLSDSQKADFIARGVEFFRTLSEQGESVPDDKMSDWVECWQQNLGHGWLAVCSIAMGRPGPWDQIV